ncbi:MAG TPA: putative peptidoglycan glycosyltransferase FtsW [Candidatus Paceibacterota bacterium]|nr:putative peptidoglycan glycosyltransferase FtsW [Candidatus Paceibacterota bacterium]
MLKSRADTMLIAIVGALLLGGALIFTSAALGLLARGATHISSVAFNHFALGIGGGLALFIAAYAVEYRRWRSLAPYLFGAALVATALVFIPGIGFEHGGGRRWIDLGFATIQPSEFLKIGAILFAAFVFSQLREQTASWRGLAAFAAIMALPGVLLLLQPDLGTLGIITMSVFAILIAAGARARDIAILMVAALCVLALLSLIPRYNYVYERIDTFFNPAAQNALSEGFQIRQSLIAIGSGGWSGRGFGQGVQKFTYLPEPMGDSIYAVLGEEFGFLGAAGLIILFLMLALRGFGVAARAPDLFGGLLAVGIATYLAGEAFINIAAMLGLAPLTGIPLTFISQGGSAMLVSLASAGILLNISRRQAKKVSA